MHRRGRIDFSRGVTAGLWFLSLQALLADLPMVHLAEVVPSNRTVPAGEAADVQALMLDVQSWYGDQMERFGFGEKTFLFDTTANGVTPKITIINAAATVATFRADVYGQTLTAATQAGISNFTPGSIWVFATDSQIQDPNGTLHGQTALGASFGSKNDGGVAVLEGDLAALAAPAKLANNSAYHGQIIPAVGPYPLAQNLSYPDFEGTTISSIASSAQGAFAHELGHAFGLAHDFRNDNNYDGNLMGNGLRGWRHGQFPSLFPTDDVQLTYAAALVLNVSSYFNPLATGTDSTKPTLSISTSGTVTPVNGALKIDFSATDNLGLYAALLLRNGEVVAEMMLNGLSQTKSFLTPYYEPGTTDTFQISLYDAQGNRRDSSVTLTPRSDLVYNRAPKPFINLLSSDVSLGQQVSLDANGAIDPDGSFSTLKVEWDLNGDGLFDTAPSTNKTFLTTYSTPGDRLIFARFTDAAGAISISEPLSLRVIPEASSTACLVAGLLALTLRRRGVKG
jgi:hypothetical protein